METSDSPALVLVKSRGTASGNRGLWHLRMVHLAAISRDDKLLCTSSNYVSTSEVGIRHGLATFRYGHL